MHEKVQFLCSNYQMQKNIIITTFMLFISRISGPVTSEIYLDIIEKIFSDKRLILIRALAQDKLSFQFMTLDKQSPRVTADYGWPISVTRMCLFMQISQYL